VRPSSPTSARERPENLDTGQGRDGQRDNGRQRRFSPPIQEGSIRWGTPTREEMTDERRKIVRNSYSSGLTARPLPSPVIYLIKWTRFEVFVPKLMVVGDGNFSPAPYRPPPPLAHTTNDTSRLYAYVTKWYRQYWQLSMDELFLKDTHHHSQLPPRV